MAEGLVHAAAFATSAGPGVAALTYSGNLLVYALPSLEPLAAAPLQRSLGFPFCAEAGSSRVQICVILLHIQAPCRWQSQGDFVTSAWQAHNLVPTTD